MAEGKITKMRNAQRRVEEFILIVKKERLPEYPGRWIDEQSKQLCVKLIKEEVGELLDAIEIDDWPEIIDGAADAIFVILYLMAKTGIPLAPFWDEVCETNMAKEGGPKDPVTGKQLKPEGWKAPRIKEILDDARLRYEAMKNLYERPAIDTEKNKEP